jgi:hypothetical protein
MQFVRNSRLSLQSFVRHRSILHSSRNLSSNSNALVTPEDVIKGCYTLRTSIQALNDVSTTNTPFFFISVFLPVIFIALEIQGSIGKIKPSKYDVAFCILAW